MSKLFRYELRRLLLNRFFLGLLVVIAFTSYSVLTGESIFGVAYTAPFSAWTYGAYLAAMLPLLMIAVLFFLTFQYTRKERQVAAITDATPVDASKYRLVRYSAIVVAYLLLCAVVIGISVWFYLRVFHFADFGAFVVPILLTLLPALCITLGLGSAAGRIHIGCLYGMMVLILLAGQLAALSGIDLTGGTFFRTYPLTLPVGALGEPVFAVPMRVWMQRIVMTLAGAGLTFAACGWAGPGRLPFYSNALRCRKKKS